MVRVINWKLQATMGIQSREAAGYLFTIWLPKRCA